MWVFSCRIIVPVQPALSMDVRERNGTYGPYSPPTVVDTILSMMVMFRPKPNLPTHHPMYQFLLLLNLNQLMSHLLLLLKHLSFIDPPV
jgi:hypothetical protein